MYYIVITVYNFLEKIQSNILKKRFYLYTAGPNTADNMHKKFVFYKFEMT